MVKNIKNWANIFKKSFSLLEVILAITFLTAGVITAIALIVSILQIISASRNSLIAAGLAQEGVEIVRNIRDSNWLNGGSGNWRNGLVAGVARQVDWRTYGLQSLGSVPLKYNSILGYGYNYTSGTSTIFTRDVTLNFVNASETSVTVIVSWSERNNTRTVRVEDHLFNWY